MGRKTDTDGDDNQPHPLRPEAHEPEPLFVNEPLQPGSTAAANAEDHLAGELPKETQDEPQENPIAPGDNGLLDHDLPTVDIPAPGLSETEPSEPPRRPQADWNRRWRMAAITLFALIAVIAMTQAFGPDEGVTAATSVPPPPTTPAVAALPIVTTLPPVPTTPPTAAPTSPPPATTPPPPPPTTTTPTTTTTEPPPPFIEPVGEAVALRNLTLSVLGIGGLEFGNDADRVLGVLTATFGQPDFDSGTVTNGELGTCDDGAYRVVAWGALAVTTRFEGDRERFDSFRIDLRSTESPGQEVELETLSGFKAGASIGQLKAIYNSPFRIAIGSDDIEGEIYELSSSQGLLFWGPVTSTGDDGLVEGLFSPSTC